MFFHVTSPPEGYTFYDSNLPAEVALHHVYIRKVNLSKGLVNNTLPSK